MFLLFVAVQTLRLILTRFLNFSFLIINTCNYNAQISSLGVALTGGTEGTIAGGMGDGSNFPSAANVLGSREIVFTNFSCTPYKVLLSINNILCAHRFFLLYFFVSFSLYTFLWACMSLCDSLFVHLFACQITHSFLNEFQPSCISTSPMYALPVILFIFSLK